MSELASKNSDPWSTASSLFRELKGPHAVEAQTRFVTLYTPLLLRWIERGNYRRDDREDILHDLMMHVLKRLQTFSHDRSKHFRGWLAKVTSTFLISRWNANLNVPKSLCDDELAALPAEDALEAYIELEEKLILVRRALAIVRTDFSPETYQAFVAFYAGKSTAEIAHELKTTPNAVNAARSRVLHRLREELREFLG